MRCVTFLGLVIIATCIDSEKINEILWIIIPVTIIALIVDLTEWDKRYGK